MKKILSFIILTAFLCHLTPYVYAECDATLDSCIDSTFEFLMQAVPSPSVGSIGGEWAVIGLARCGKTPPDEYFKHYYEAVSDYVSEKNGVLHRSKYTEYSRIALALTSIGKEPCDIVGYNLLLPLKNFKNTVRQGTNGAVWAIIALENGMTDISKNIDEYIEWLLNCQNPDGGFSVSDGGESEADITAMVLTALARYRGKTQVEQAVLRAVSYLSNAQNENGGFSVYGTETAESDAQVIIALCTLGIPIEDSRFVKNGKTAFDNMMSYSLSGGGFCHTHDDINVNQMASEQCFLALVALSRFSNGQAPLYDIAFEENINSDGKKYEKKDYGYGGYYSRYNDIIHSLFAWRKRQDIY